MNTMTEVMISNWCRLWSFNQITSKRFFFCILKRNEIKRRKENMENISKMNSIKVNHKVVRLSLVIWNHKELDWRVALERRFEWNDIQILNGKETVRKKVQETMKKILWESNTRAETCQKSFIGASLNKKLKVFYCPTV